MAMATGGLTLKAVRRNCVECSGGSPKYVAYCSCDGTHSTRCEFWPFRFGMNPETAASKYGEKFLDPEQMPPAGADLEDLPEVKPIPRTPKRAVSAEERAVLAERLRKARFARATV